jgi:hypothetical protein
VHTGICTAYPLLQASCSTDSHIQYMDWTINTPSAHYRPITPIDIPFCVYNWLTYYVMRIDWHVDQLINRRKSTGIINCSRHIRD